MTAQKQSSILTQELVDVVLLGRGTVASPGFVSPTYYLYNPAARPMSITRTRPRSCWTRRAFRM